MNRVFIRCPETGKMVFTGFAMDPKLFESFPELTEAFHCTACGKDHAWKKSDAIFEGQREAH